MTNASEGTNASEDEIYSIMFSSLKHPVRRKILRMLGSKPMTFMEMVDELGVSSPHLTYHLESLGDLVFKMENGKYKLSTFGLASVSAMKGVEDVHEAEPKRRLATSKTTILLGAMLIAIIVLASFSFMQYNSVNALAASQKELAAENQALLAWGVGTDKVAYFVRNVTHIDTRQYTIDLLSNTLEWRTDLGGVSEEVAQYSLRNGASDLSIDFRFRNGHFSRYELGMTESLPIFTQTEPTNVLQNARGVLSRYYAYSGDAYLADMLKLLDKINMTNPTVTEGNLKLEVSNLGGIAGFFWMYTDGGIDYQIKGLQMIFQNNILTTMTDGFFLFQKGNAGISISEERAAEIAKDYVKTITWTIEGKSVSGFRTVDPPLYVQMYPHTRGNSVELIPYWYVEMSLDQTYAGGINRAKVGIYADTGQVAEVQLLSGSIEMQSY